RFESLVGRDPEGSAPLRDPFASLLPMATRREVTSVVECGLRLELERVERAEPLGRVVDLTESEEALRRTGPLAVLCLEGLRFPQTRGEVPTGRELGGVLRHGQVRELSGPLSEVGQEFVKEHTLRKRIPDLPGRAQFGRDRHAEGTFEHLPERWKEPVLFQRLQVILVAEEEVADL